MQRKPWQISLTAVCILSGVLFAYDLQLHPKTGQGPTTQKNERMVKMIEQYEQENQSYEEEITKLRTELDTVQKAQASGQSNLTGLQDQLDKARMKAGLVTVEGPGIVLTLKDRDDALALAKQSGEPFDIWDYIVHDTFLLNLVTDLRAAGAEAIALNEERIVTTTDIKCGGTIVFANSTRLGAPFTIKAIGNPEALVKALEQSFTYNTLAYNKYPINVTKNEKVFIPAYRGSYSPKFAVIAKE